MHQTGIHHHNSMDAKNVFQFGWWWSLGLLHEKHLVNVQKNVSGVQGRLTTRRVPGSHHLPSTQKKTTKNTLRDSYPLRHAVRNPGFRDTAKIGDASSEASRHEIGWKHRFLKNKASQIFCQDKMGWKMLKTDGILRSLNFCETRPTYTWFKSYDIDFLSMFFGPDKGGMRAPNKLDDMFLHIGQTKCIALSWRLGEIKSIWYCTHIPLFLLNGKLKNQVPFHGVFLMKASKSNSSCLVLHEEFQIEFMIG